MRWIRDQGGPCLGYQSEVEHLKKNEVRSDLLAMWVQLLQVTEPLARGQITRYFSDPAACRGLAADVGQMILAREQGDPVLARMEPVARAREVLRLIARDSKKLPRVVLAYVLGLQVSTLDAIMLGEHPLVREQVHALADLTTLPVRFFTGVQVNLPEGDGDWQAYLPVIRLCMQQGITSSELQAMVAERLLLSESAD